MAHPFLSPAWIEAAQEIQKEYEGAAVAHPVRMNHVITDVPFGDGTMKTHLDTTSGEVVLELGHIDAPDVTVTTDYDTAKAVFVAGDPQAGMQAFMSGKIKVDGDLTKLVGMAQAPIDPRAIEVQQRLRAITE